MRRTPSYNTDNLRTASDWHAYWVYNDPEFINECGALKKALDFESYNRLSVKYALNPEQVYRFHMGKYLYLSKVKTQGTGKLTWDVMNTGRLILSFDWSITKAEFLEFWEEFLRLRKHISHSQPPKKRKPPENTQLIYAVFKARMNKLSFKKIFSMYENGNLPLYSGSNKQFKYEEALERYYDKYKPTQKPAT